MRKIKSKGAHCDVQDSSLNSSLAEVLASMSASTAAGVGVPAVEGHGSHPAPSVRASSPVLAEQEILSSSLQEFLKYDDPLSPLAEIGNSSALDKMGGQPVVPEVAGNSPSRGARFVVSRNPSFTPSLKGFLFSAEDLHQDAGGDFLTKIEVSCTPTTGTESKSQSSVSSNDSSDPRSYMPRLTDGSVSVLHSVGNNNSNDNNKDDLSSLDDSMRMSDDESSTSRDRNTGKEVIDLGAVKEELEKRLGRAREENVSGVGNDGGVGPAIDNGGQTSEVVSAAPQSRNKPSAVQALIESFEVFNGVMKPVIDQQLVADAKLDSPARLSTATAVAHQQHRTVTISPMKKPRASPSVAPTPPSESNRISPADAAAQEPALCLTSQPETRVNCEPSTETPMKLSRPSHAATSPRRPSTGLSEHETRVEPSTETLPRPSTAATAPRRPSMGKTAPESPTASPSRRHSCSPKGRTSMGSTGSRRRQELPPALLVESPTLSSSKRRNKSSPCLSDSTGTVEAKESPLPIQAPSETLPKGVGLSDNSRVTTPDAAISEAHRSHKTEVYDHFVTTTVSEVNVSETVTLSPASNGKRAIVSKGIAGTSTNTELPAVEHAQTQDETNGFVGDFRPAADSDVPASSGPSESMPAALSVPQTPKSPKRELRLKIQIDEMMRPDGDKQGVVSYNLDGAGIEDDALPQVLKTLLDGVASKIRKHAKQESMRKIRTNEVAALSAEGSVRRVALPPGAVGAESSPSAMHRIKVRVEKSGTSKPSSPISRTKSREYTSGSPRKPESRRTAPREAGVPSGDFEPHGLSKGDPSQAKERSNDPSKSPNRYKSRDREERSRSRSTRESHQRSDAARPRDTWDQQTGHQTDGPTGDRTRRRSVERGARSRSVSGGEGREERDRAHSSSDDNHRRSSRAGSRPRSSTSKQKGGPGYETSKTSASLATKLERGGDAAARNANSASKSISSKSSRKGRKVSLRDDDRDNTLVVRASLSEALEKSNNKLSGPSGTKSVCSKNSRKYGDEESSRHGKRPSISGSQSVSSKSSRRHREEGSARQGRRSSPSGSQSVCSKSSRKQRDCEEASGRQNRSHHSKSTHSISKSTHSSSKSAHSSSRSISTKSKTHHSAAPVEDHRVSDHTMTETTEAIEYDFNDEVVPDSSAVADSRGRTYRRGSGSSTTRGRSQSTRHLRATQDGDIGTTGRSQSHRHLSTERKSSLTKSSRSQSHRQLSSSGGNEYHLGLGTGGPASRSSTRSSSQPPKASRQAREASVERPGSPRARSRSRPGEGRSQGSGRGLSRLQIEEGVTSVASGASDKTPRRSGGRGPSPNARSRQQPTTILKQMGKTPVDPPTEPPGQSPVEQQYAAMTVGRLRGVHKALSFRELFSREPEPWQEFSSPASKPKPSCLPPASAATNASTATATTATATATTTTTTATSKGRSMPKFLSSMSSSFHRSISLRGFPEVSKAELDASFDAFPNVSDRSGNQGWTPKLFR